MSWPTDPQAFHLHEIIGYTPHGFPSVYRASVAVTQEQVAIKIVDLEALLSNPLELERVMQGIRLGRQIKHPNILEVHTAFIACEPNNTRSWEDFFEEEEREREAQQTRRRHSLDQQQQQQQRAAASAAAASAAAAGNTQHNVPVLTVQRPGEHVSRRLSESDVAATPSSSRSSSRPSSPQSRSYSAQLWIVMPLMAKGSVGDILATSHPDGFDEPTTMFIVREVTKALEVLHQLDLVHRSIRAASVYIAADNSVKLGGLQYAESLVQHGERKTSLHSFVLTPALIPWVAPEYLRQDMEGYTQKADIYSLAVLTAELGHGRHPFDGLDNGQIFLYKVLGYAPQLPSGPEAKVNFSRHAHQLVERCSLLEPHQRPSCTRLLTVSAFKQVRRTPQSYQKLLKALPPLEERAGVLGMARRTVGAQPQTSLDVPLTDDASIFRHAFPGMESGGLSLMRSTGRDADEQLHEGSGDNLPSIPRMEATSPSFSNHDLGQMIARITSENARTHSQDSIGLRRVSNGSSQQAALGKPKGRHQRNRSHGGIIVLPRVRKRSSSEPPFVAQGILNLAAESVSSDQSSSQQSSPQRPGDVSSQSAQDEDDVASYSSADDSPVSPDRLLGVPSDNDEEDDEEGDDRANYSALERVDSEKYHRIQKTMSLPRAKEAESSPPSFSQLLEMARSDGSSEVFSNLPPIKPLVSDMPDPHLRSPPMDRRRQAQDSEDDLVQAEEEATDA